MLPPKAWNTLCTLTSKRPLLDPNLLRLPRPALLLAVWGSPGTAEVWRLSTKLPRLSNESYRCMSARGWSTSALCGPT